MLLNFVTHKKAIILIAALSSLGTTSGKAIAQIIPDDSLGEGRSHVTPSVMIRGEMGDTHSVQEIQRIDGGVTRSTSLFHSFEAFNVDANQRIYFANPRGIQSIFSRITGNNNSNIFGTLGVDGNADLYLINPNGIIFGENAQLDIRGSFFATTADAFVFENGSQFSAIDPELPPLLAVNVAPGLQYGSNPEAIANQADLRVGRDLTLAAGRINHTGTLSAEFGNLNLEAIAGDLVLSDDSIAQADKNLTLYATGQVWIADTVLSSGEELRTEGEEAITLSNSDISSGRDMVFRSPVRQLGDRTLFTTGGYFVTETSNGTVVDFLIPHEHVILARGDVRLDANYQGPSLYVLAGGRVTVAADVTSIEIDSAEENQITRDISNGMGGIQQVTIQSADQPTFDGRSGINWSNFPGLDIANTNTSNAFVSFGNSSNPNYITDANLNLAHIDINNPVNITSAGGLVYLSNQYYPNPKFSGNILINSIDTSGFLAPISTTIESRNRISINGTINTSFLPRNTLSSLIGPNASLDELSELFSSANTTALPNAGNVTLLAEQAITIQPGSTIESLGQHGGDIVLIVTQGTINLDDTIIASVSIDTGADGNTPLGLDSRPSGNILLESTSIIVNPFSKVLNIALLGQRPAGNLTATATDQIQITNRDGTSITELTSFPPTLLTNQFDGFSESTGLATTALAEAEAGQITVNSLHLSIQSNQENTDPNLSNIERSTGILSASLRDSSGDAGDIFINSDTVLIQGSQPGTLEVPNTVERAQLFSRVTTGINLTARGTGLPGNLNLQTRQLTMADGAAIISGVVGSLEEQSQSDRALSINVDERLSLEGKAIISIATLSSGNSGDLNINISESGDGLFLTNGAVISADSVITQDSPPDSIFAGSAGAINIAAPIVSLVNNARIGAASSDNGGPAGSIAITTNRLRVVNSLISTSSENDIQTAGNIVIDARDSIQLRGRLEQDNRSGGILAEATQDGDAGRITVTTPQLRIEDRSAILTSTNVGIGGDIRLQGIDNLAITNGQISGSTQTGQAGSILINPGSHLATQVLLQGDDSTIAARADSDGGIAGDILINSRHIQVLDGAAISASNLSSPNHSNSNRSDQLASNGQLLNAAIVDAGATETNQPTGNIQILGADIVELNRGEITASTETGIAGDIAIESAQIVQLDNNSRLAVEASGVGGLAGSLTLMTSELRMSDSSAITVQSRKGQAGNIAIAANQVMLDSSEISAVTGQNTSGAEIRMEGLDFLFMTGESLISAAAGDAADGGRVAIDADDGFVIGTQDNNDIVASAIGGTGGDINITALDIFGLEERETRTPFSDINASSDFGADGAIAISSLEVNPLNGALELPNTLVDVAQLVDQQLCQVAQGSAFVITGQGGVQSSPHEPFRSEDLWEDWRLTTVPETSDSTNPQTLASHNLASGTLANPAIIEAQGWQRTSTGAVILTARLSSDPPSSTGTMVALPTQSPLVQCQTPILRSGE